MPELSTDPPPLNAHPTFLNISTVESAPPMPPFPPSHFEALPPAGVFVGVFSMDSSSERRMLIRSTWASHARSRNGAGNGDGGEGTSRTIVRFIMGQPRKAWERRVRVEMEGARPTLRRLQPNDTVMCDVQSTRTLSSSQSRRT